MASETLNFNLFARDNASGVFNKFGNNVDQAESKFSKFGSGVMAVGKLAGAGAVALGALGVAGGMMGLKVAAANEQAMISFTTMLGSGKKAGAFLKDLQAFAAKTPFEFPELQTAASSLISAGFQAKKVIPIMTTLGDVTSGMGTGSEGVKRATVALQQMSAAGRITGEDLNQLRDAGVPVFDLLSAATGKTKEQISALAQSGKLGKTEMEALFKALETGNGLERFNGLMEKQAQSLTGLWSTFKDTLGQGLAQAITPLIPLIKDGLGAASEFLATALVKLPPVISTITGFFGGFSGAASGVGSVIGSLADWVTGSLIPAFRQVGETLLPKLQGMFASVSGTISENQGLFKALGIIITQVLIPNLGRVAGVLAETVGPAFKVVVAIVRDFVIPIWATLANVFLEAVGLIVNGAAKAFGWVPGLGPKLKGAAKSFNEFKDDMQETLSAIVAAARGTGENISEGLAAGIAAKSGMAVEQARQTVNRINKMMADTAETASPSKFTIRIGEFIAEGLGIGIKNKTAIVLDATKDMIGKVTEKLAGLKDQVKTIMSGVRDAMTGALDVGSLGASITTPGGTDAEGNALPDVTTTPRVNDQLSSFAAQAGAFSAALSSAISKGLNPSLIAKVASLGPIQGMTAAQALGALDSAQVAQANASLALADKFGAQLATRVVNTTGLPADVARQQAILDTLRKIRQEVKGGDTVFHIHDATDPDAVVAAIRRYIKKNGKLRDVAAD